MTRTAEQIVNREVHYCVSHLVSTLAAGAYQVPASTNALADLNSACEQAFELCSPILDWEEAARELGFYEDPEDANVIMNAESGGLEFTGEGRWQRACERDDIEPYAREVFEHWIVSDWLADRLAEKGEKVDKDFAGMTVWARTTTGQGIASDSVIEAIVADLNKEA